MAGPLRAAKLDFGAVSIQEQGLLVADLELRTGSRMLIGVKLPGRSHLRGGILVGETGALVLAMGVVKQLLVFAPPPGLYRLSGVVVGEQQWGEAGAEQVIEIPNDAFPEHTVLVSAGTVQYVGKLRISREKPVFGKTRTRFNLDRNPKHEVEGLNGLLDLARGSPWEAPIAERIANPGAPIPSAPPEAPPAVAAGSPAASDSSAQDAPTDEPVGRPLLHTEVARDARGDGRLLCSAVYANGRRAGSFADTFATLCGASWAPGGEEFSFISVHPSGGTVKAMNLQGGRRTLFKAEEREGIVAWQAAWCPGGRRLAVLSVLHENGKPQLVVVDAAGGARPARHRLPNKTLAGFPFFTQPPNKFRWSPDGRKVLISWGTVVVVDVVSGKVQTILDRPAVAEWAPAGDGVYYIPVSESRPAQWEGFFVRRLNAAKPVQLADATRLSSLGLVAPRGMNYGSMTLSPSGSLLAIAAGADSTSRGALRVYATAAGVDVNLGEPRLRLDTDLVTAVDWAPDEKYLATVSIGDVIRMPLPSEPVVAVVRVVSLDGNGVKTVGTFELNASKGELDLLGFKTLSWTQ